MRTFLIACVLAVTTSAATAQVVIHEFVARNNTGIQDENNQYEDWLELANLSGSSVDISGYYMTDDLNVPTKWIIPANTVLAPGATLLIWCDEDLNEGPFHADFKLSAAGEEIGLFARNGTTLVDSVTFGPQLIDVSEGRLVGSTRNVWYAFPTPTPRAFNQPEPCGTLVIDAKSSAPNPGGALAAVASPKVGTMSTWALSGAAANTGGQFALSAGSGHFGLGNYGTLFLDPTKMALLPLSTDNTGAASVNLPVPNVAALAGVTFYVQAFAVNGIGGGLSNGIIARVCP